MAPIDLPETFNLVLSIFSTVLSVFALWLSIHFYRLSNELNNRMIGAISELTVSAKTTEVTTTQITSRALDVLAGHFEHRVDAAEQQGVLEVARTVGAALAEAPPQKRHRAQVEATRAVTDAFLQVKVSVAPAAAEYDWGPFLRRMDELQRANRFLSVKWLHRRIFADEPGMQEALQVAIHREMLETYHLRNPRSPHPTLCCALNRAHPSVVAALAQVDGY